MDPHEDVIGSGVIGADLLPLLAVDYEADELVGAGVLDDTQVVLSPTLVSSGVLAEVVTDDAFLLVASSGVAREVVSYYTVYYPMLVADTMVGDGEADSGLNQDITDGGIVAEAASVVLAPPVLTSTGDTGDALTLSTTVQPTVVCGASTVGAVLYPFQVADCAVTGALAETTYRTLSAVKDVTDTGTVASEAVTGSAVEVAVVVTGRLADVVSARATTYATLIDRLDGWGTAQAEGAVAWTANTDNWAASRYAPYDFQSLAAFQGGLFATGAAGLVQIGADRDGADLISARVESHLTDFGNENLKLPRALYLGYTSNQALTVTMTATDDGQETAYEYAAQPRLAETFVPGRIPLGRGLRSRYLRFALANESGGSFEVDGAYIDADVSERRV